MPELIVDKDILRTIKLMYGGAPKVLANSSEHYLVAANTVSMLLYHNPKEVNVEGTFKLNKWNLIPAEISVDSNPREMVDKSSYSRMTKFDKDLKKFQRYCYDKNIRFDFVANLETVMSLFEKYNSFMLYVREPSNDILLEFSNSKHSVSLITKGI
jgi:hypothetical protein